MLKSNQIFPKKICSRMRLYPQNTPKYFKNINKANGKSTFRSLLIQLFFLKLRTNVKINTFLNIGMYNTCTCEISCGRGNRTPKPKRQSPKPHRWAFRKFNSCNTRLVSNRQLNLSLTLIMTSSNVTRSRCNIRQKQTTSIVKQKNNARKTIEN